MLKAVRLQFIAAFLGCVLGAAIWGWRGGFSAAFGGLACVVPSLFFALRMHSATKRPGASYALAFYVGEAIKIALTIAILALIYFMYPSVHWGAVVIGMIVTLQANFLALLVKP